MIKKSSRGKPKPIEEEKDQDQEALKLKRFANIFASGFAKQASLHSDLSEDKGNNLTF